uniref:Serine/threonine-protein kinase SRK2A isoform X2 n=1 Tax=Rhizophora mucronata TaxID=61149 RepID=A0A2P2JKL6_RHIMU
MQQRRLGITKITNFQTWGWTPIQQGIFQLQVSMAYLHVMTIANSRNKLLEEVPCLIFTESSSIAYSLKELSPCSILHNYGEMGWCQNQLLEANYVRMAK